MWISSIQNEEGAFARGAMDSIVVCEFGKWQPVGPIVLVIVNEDPEIFLDLLVNLLGLAIRLRMPGSRCIRHDVEQSVKLLHELGYELRAVVRDDDLRHSVLSIDVIPEDPCPSFS